MKLSARRNKNYVGIGPVIIGSREILVECTSSGLNSLGAIDFDTDNEVRSADRSGTTFEGAPRQKITNVVSCHSLWNVKTDGVISLM